MVTIRENDSLILGFVFHLHDNRPLKPDEFEEVTNQTVYVSATPAAFEMENSSIVVEQLIRPTDDDPKWSNDLLKVRWKIQLTRSKKR